MKPPQLTLAVILILGLGIGLPILGNLALPQWLPAWRHVPFHTAIEFYGTFIALLLAWLLFRLRQRGEAAPDYYWMACGFIGMGLLDGMHALTLPGEAFVWFHATATLVGGLGFALMGRPEPPRRTAKVLPGVIAGGALAVGLLALLVPDSVPSMLVGGHLTLLARSLNAIGGVLFLVAAVRFAVLYREIRGWDEFWFTIHAALFGSAGVLFAGSELWDPAWWWHFLRFAAYSIALRFVLLTYRRLGERLTQAKWAEEALHEREVGLHAIVDTASDGISIIDRAGRLVEINPAGLMFMECEKVSQAIGQPVYSYVAAEYLDAYRTFHERILGGEAGTLEFEIVGRKGTRRWMESRSGPLRNPANGQIMRFAICRDITERRRSQAQIQYLAYHDTLTGLPNRALLLDRLERALAQAERYNQLMALLYLDLDHFKLINDTLGHGVGDRLLKEIAARLSSALREEDTVVRLGGDEFLIILPRIFVPHDATPVAEKVTAALSRTFVIQGHELHVTASIGISVYPKDGKDKETLMEHADVALYQAKEAGRNTYQFFNRETNAQAQERSILENALRAALEGGGLMLHYQPQVDLQSRSITGLEALVRWRHPELGIVPPSASIPIAEESGLITPIGEWIVRNACVQTRTWQETGLPGLRIAVPVSTRQLRYGDLPAAISRILAETGLEPPYLELELAESSLIIDPAHAAEVLTRLHAMGVQLALDDFGTGYSSLVYLKRFPFRRVRIAGSLVRDLPQDPAMVQAILALARQFGMKAVAKGVETEEQRALLQAYACDEVQGPRFSPPVTAEAVLPLFGK